jgi:hypothetical protein
MGSYDHVPPVVCFTVIPLYQIFFLGRRDKARFFFERMRVSTS